MVLHCGYRESTSPLLPTNTPPRKYCNVTVPSGVPSKLRRLAHIRFSTGAIRPMQSIFRVLRRQSPLTAGNRRTSFTSIPIPLHQRPLLPATQRAPVGGFAFRNSWRCSGIIRWVVWRMLHACSPSSPGHCLTPTNTAVVNTSKWKLGDRDNQLSRSGTVWSEHAIRVEDNQQQTETVVRVRSAEA